MAQPSSVVEWAPHRRINIFVRLFSFTRTAWTMLALDNPLTWKLGIRGKNAFDDIEGPFYIVGSPSREVDDGKGILATVHDLTTEENDPFLFILDVKDIKGEPVPDAVLDCWQANSAGEYYFASWTLRGKVRTDAQGHVEILTVRPGDYANRAGHLHIKTAGTKGTHVAMTTQAYVCSGNNPKLMDVDIANWVRPPRAANMASCWSTDGKFDETPKVPADRVDLANTIERWDRTLKERGVQRGIRGVATHEFKLTVC